MYARTGTVAGAAVVLSVLTVLAALAQPPREVGNAAAAGEWPGWRGPDRTGVSRETNLLRSWPQDGPRLLWKAEGLGGGYSTPSVAGGRIFGMSYRDNDEVVWALDANTGKEIWKTRIAPANRKVGYGEGSRSTPAVDGDRVYALGVNGDLVCMQAADGRLCWQKNLAADFGGGVPGFGYCESPLVDGDKLVVTPGGKAATLVALDKRSGEVVWKAAIAEGDAAHYSSVIAADVDGERQYIQFLSGGVVGIRAEDGKLLWRYGQPANGNANIATPIYHEGHVFATSAYNKGGGLVKLTTSAGGVSADEVYFTRQLRNHHGGVVLVGGHLYGFDESNLTCLDFLTGKVAWTDRSVGKGSLMAAGGHLYVRGERGTIALVEATPSGYVEKARFDPPSRSGKGAWAHPVIAGGRLYLRDQDTLLCYDVKQPAEGK
jgi:outer membrane protein assembly factor BamB